MSYHGENALQYINRGSFSLNGCQISGYFDTRFSAVAIIDPILHKFEDLKIVNFLNPEQVYFLVACVRCAFNFFLPTALFKPLLKNPLEVFILLLVIIIQRDGYPDPMPVSVSV